MFVKEGRNHNLSCQSSSASASRYRWYIGEKLINVIDSAKYSVSTPSGQDLHIVNISESEIGDYSCEVSEDSVHVPRNATGFVRFTRECTGPLQVAVTSSCLCLVKRYECALQLCLNATSLVGMHHYLLQSMASP